MNLPSHIEEFDMLQFINNRANLLYVYQAMEIQLEAFKTKNPNTDVSEALKRIDILRHHYDFIGRLERECGTLKRVNSDYVLANLHLIAENEELKRQIEVLKNQMQEL